MVAKRVVRVEPGSEIDQLLTEAGERPILLEWHGKRLCIAPDPSSHEPTYDPARVQESIRRIAGLWKGLDVETFEKEILEEREQDSIGRPR